LYNFEGQKLATVTNILDLIQKSLIKCIHPGVFYHTASNECDHMILELQWNPTKKARTTVVLALRPHCDDKKWYW